MLQNTLKEQQTHEKIFIRQVKAQYMQKLVEKQQTFYFALPQYFELSESIILNLTSIDYHILDCDINTVYLNRRLGNLRDKKEDFESSGSLEFYTPLLYPTQFGDQAILNTLVSNGILDHKESAIIFFWLYQTDSFKRVDENREYTFHVLYNILFTFHLKKYNKPDYLSLLNCPHERLLRSCIEKHQQELTLTLDEKTGISKYMENPSLIVNDISTIDLSCDHCHKRFPPQLYENIELGLINGNDLATLTLKECNDPLQLELFIQRKCREKGFD